MPLPAPRPARLALLLALFAPPLLAGEIHEATKVQDLERVRALLAENPELRTATAPLTSPEGHVR